jgi:hypothetical protein
VNLAHHQGDLRWEDRRVGFFSPGIALSAKAFIATASGLAGAVGVAFPLVIYGWASSTHTALELPMAATAWLFGLGNFTPNGYDWSSIAVGALALAAYGILGGAVFGGFADRFLRLTTLPETLGVGLAWGFVNWMFFWYTLLPAARDGAPFHPGAVSVVLGSNTWGAPETLTAVALAVAPIWVFLVGFTLLGLATALVYRLSRRR